MSAEKARRSRPNYSAVEENRTGSFIILTVKVLKKSDWTKIFKKLMKADILISRTPIWLGEKSSVCLACGRKLLRRIRQKRMNSENIFYYGKTGGCIITGNEDGH